MMIDQELWNRLEDQANQINAELQRAIINLIVARILAHDYSTLIPSNVHLVRKLQESGMLMEDIRRVIAARTGKAQADVRRIFEDSYIQEIDFSNAAYKDVGVELPVKLTPGMHKIMDDAIRQTNGELRNLTGTMAISAHNMFVDLIDKAYFKVRSGSYSYEQVIADAVAEAIDRGAYIEYPSGHRDRVEVATRRAVLAGINQGSIRRAVEQCRELGWNHISVSSHLGARVGQKGKPAYANHSAWQGQIYWLDTPDGEHQSFVTECGWGHGDGIGGWGCRHSAFPWRPGMGNPFKQYDSVENRRRYEAEQKQRAKERRIRDEKNRLVALRQAIDAEKDPAVKSQLQKKYDRTAANLRLHNTDYKAYCKDTGLKPYQERLKTARWGAEESHRALLAANRYHSEHKDGIIDKRIAFPDQEFAGNSSVRDYTDEIKSGLEDIEKDYEFSLDRVEVASMPEDYRYTPMLYRAEGDGQGLETKLIVNSASYFWKDVKGELEKLAGRHVFASKSVREMVWHELAHAITFSGCRTFSEVEALSEELKEKYVPGMSLYNDTAMDGSESIAEAFVRKRKGLKVPEGAEKLLEVYIDRRKK